MAAMNEPESRLDFVNQMIQQWNDRIQEAEQDMVEYTENTPNPTASRVQFLRGKIDRARNSLEPYIVERQQLIEGRAPGLRQRVRSRRRSSSHGRFRRRSPGHSPGHSPGRSLSRSPNRGTLRRSLSRSPNRGTLSRSPSRSASRSLSRSPNRGTRRRSRCPQGSNCTVS